MFWKSKDKKEPEKNADVRATDSTDLVDLGSEYGEIALDSFLDDGVLQDIPVLRTVVSGVKIYRNYRDHAFAKKVARFLGPLKETNRDERVKFAKEMEQEEGGVARIGENLLMLLERLDDVRKPAMVGKLYVAHIKGLIDFKELQILTAAVDRLLLAYLPDLRDFYMLGGDPAEGLALQHLANCGLVTLRNDALIGAGGATYSKNELGKQFISYAL